MATPIPALVSEIQIDDDTKDVAYNYSIGSITQQTTTLSQAYRYYLVSNMATVTASNGVSLLAALKTALEALSTAQGNTLTFTVKLSAGYKVQISHNGAGTATIVLDTALALGLGFTSATVTVTTGATTTATNYSKWWWTPDMPVSMTGPQAFDPAISYGVPSSAGTAQRSSDMTGAFTDNGVQTEATYTFNGVEFYYKIRPQSGYTNADLETFWSNGPRKGRRLLWWRDRDNAVGSHVPSEGSATPYNYIIYQPNATLRGTFPAVATAPPRLTHWDVTFGLWSTELGEGVLSD